MDVRHWPFNVGTLTAILYNLLLSCKTFKNQNIDLNEQNKVRKLLFILLLTKNQRVSFDTNEKKCFSLISDVVDVSYFLSSFS